MQKLSSMQYVDINNWPVELKEPCHYKRHVVTIEIGHFDGAFFPYTLRAPRQYTSFYLARNSRAGEAS